MNSKLNNNKDSGKKRPGFTYICFCTLLLSLLCIVQYSFVYGETRTADKKQLEALCTYANKMIPELKGMLKTNVSMLTELDNPSESQIDSAGFDCDNGFYSHNLNINLNDADKAEKINDLVNSTVYYYIPFEIPETNGLLGCFSYDPNNNGGEINFVSFGAAKYAETIKKAKKRIENIKKNSPNKNLNCHMVAQPAGDLELIYCNDENSTEEFLAFKTEEMEQAAFPNKSDNDLEKMDLQTTREMLTQINQILDKQKEQLTINKARFKQNRPEDSNIDDDTNLKKDGDTADSGIADKEDVDSPGDNKVSKSKFGIVLGIKPNDPNASGPDGKNKGGGWSTLTVGLLTVMALLIVFLIAKFIRKQATA